MTSTHEPPPKRKRKIRTIELDLSQFPEWVGEASDSTLVEALAIGVKVKDFITINITENPEVIKNALDKNLQPVHDKVKEMSSTIDKVKSDMKSDAVALKNELVSDVQGVAKKVPSLESLNTKIDSVVKELKPSIVDVLTPLMQRCDQNLAKLVTKFEKPTTKGALGEEEIASILQVQFPTYTINKVSGQGRQGDIHITTNLGQKYLVEVKDHEKTVPSKEIEKFVKNVSENQDFKVGILFSLRSGIAVRASQGRFTVTFRDDRYYIYVPNALNETKDLVVWIVMLADQLAKLNQGLTDSQTQVVSELLREFQQNVETSKICQTNLRSLKRAVEDLEKNMNPLLKIIDEAKRKLNKVLHKE